MEIFVKENVTYTGIFTHIQSTGKSHKLKWLNSLPTQFRHQIWNNLSQRGLGLKPDGNYKVVVSLGDPLKPHLKNTDSNPRDTKMKESDEANNKRIILQRKSQIYSHSYRID